MKPSLCLALWLLSLPLHAQSLSLKINQTSYTLPLRDTSLADFQIRCQQSPSLGGQRWQVWLETKKPLALQAAQLRLPQTYSPQAQILAQGWQSWTESPYLSPHERLRSLRRLARPYMQYMGDYPFTPYGQAHAQSYTEIRQEPDTNLVHFWGSLTEETGWTSFRHHAQKQELWLDKDLGIQIQGSYCLFDLWEGKGEQQQQYQSFFQTFLGKYPLQIPSTQPPLLAGWTSWYLHYTKIDQQLILRIAKDYAQYRQEAGQSFPSNLHWVIQIDDGWQAKTGDWLEIKTQKFPLGMKALADSIKAQGMMPGLWLAPFICSKASSIAKKHPDWLLKNSKGQPLKVGVNPLWDGAYYALDIYHPEVQNHLQQVLQTLSQDWGYELLKIDFLYAVAAQNRPDKTRAQVMHDAMRLLRSWVGPKVKLLGCGLPLAAGWGQVDYARIGADIYEKWDHGALRWARHRERLSTKLSLTNTLSRHPLDGKIWGNDPDVVILRNKKHRLSKDQKTKLLYLNALSGSVFFNSDALLPLNPNWKNEYQKALQWFGEKQQTQWILDRSLQFQGKAYLPSQGHWLLLKGGLKN